MIYELAVMFAIVFAIVMLILVNYLLFADDNVTLTQMVVIETLLIVAYLMVLVIYFIATG